MSSGRGQMAIQHKDGAAVTFMKEGAVVIGGDRLVRAGHHVVIGRLVLLRGIMR